MAGTGRRALRRYSTITGIEAIPCPDVARSCDIRERLSCGHLGSNHGGTWEGTEAPLRNRASHYTHLIGRKRQCDDCSYAASRAEAERHNEA